MKRKTLLFAPKIQPLRKPIIKWQDKENVGPKMSMKPRTLQR